MGKNNKENFNEQDFKDKDESTDTDLDNDNEETKEEKEMDLDVENILEKYNKKVEELEELSNRYLRLQADFNNFKRRTEKEKENSYQYAVQDIVTSLLPIIDNFDRALKINIEESTLESLYKGVEMVYKQLIEVLEAKGLEEIKALGEAFDPNYHHAVAQEENDDYEENKIIEVFLKGYKIKDKVIRPSMVKVSK